MDAIVLNQQDNIAVVLRETASGEFLLVGHDEVISVDRIPYGHKIARCDIPEGDSIRKYGMAVGQATADIPKGGYVHVQNVTSIYMDNEQDHYE
jgi:altronate dehydratase